jgi:predicted DNA-binding protein (UPF0251 family)
VDAVNMREDLRQIVGDVQELPETQRTALLLREIDGLSYDQIAAAMDTSVPGVKSLLVRARVSLAEAAEGRLLSCQVVHLELRQAAEGLARLGGPARRHARHCDVCAAYQAELGLTRRAAAAAFLPLTPLALIKAVAGRLTAGAAGGTGAGLASGGGAAGTGAAAGAAGGAAGGAVTATLGAVGAKVAVGVATATLVAAGAADIHRASSHHARHAGARQAPVAISPGLPREHSTPVVMRPAVAPTHGTKHANPHSTTPNQTSSPTTPVSDQPLPATQQGGGAFPDSPPPPSSSDRPSGKMNPPTDPAKQPIGAPEPVQVQGFDPQQSSSGDASSGSSSTSP